MGKDLVLERLNTLVAKGYLVRWGQSERDTLRLEHPRAPDLTLFPDGRIWVLTMSPEDWIGADDKDEHRFQAFVSPNDWIGSDNEADQRRFKSFLARVPKPTTLQSFKAMAMEDLWIRAWLWTLVVLISITGAFIGIWVVRLVTRQ
jgi:hypothetical protein